MGGESGLGHAVVCYYQSCHTVDVVLCNCGVAEFTLEMLMITVWPRAMTYGSTSADKG